MNARQKAKKYKRMYEELIKQPLRFEVKKYKIDTLKFERFYPTPVITQENSSYYAEVVTKDIARDIRRIKNGKTRFRLVDEVPTMQTLLSSAGGCGRSTMQIEEGLSI